MLQRIRNLAKKIFPPPARVFHSEITRVLDAIGELRSAIKSLDEAQKAAAAQLRSQDHQAQILDEIAAMRKTQEQVLTLNSEQHRVFSLKMKAYEDTIASLAKDNAALKHQLENQDKELLRLNSEIRRQGHCITQTIDRANRRAANAPILSVLIPVYNVEAYLRECLDSVVNQSMKEIEIICVDDGSTDGSLQILEEYAQKDARIQVIHKDKNEGLLLARKAAVAAASGAYILFVDSDDYIAPNLCTFAEEITRTEYADIIQFGADVCDYANNAAKAAWLRNALIPAPRELETSKEIMREAYVTRSYVTSLWGKLYKSELCKKAYAALPDVYCYVGEDIFTFFYLSYYAQSYKGIPTRAYYTYRHGLGVTNVEIMTLEKFETYCNMANFVKYIHDNLIHKSTDPNLLEAYNAMTRRVTQDCCWIYASRIRAQDKPAAWEMLVSYWGGNPIAEETAQKILGISLGQCKEEQELYLEKEKQEESK